MPQERNTVPSLSSLACDVRYCYRKVPSESPVIETISSVAAASSCRHADVHWPWPSLRRWSWLAGMELGGRTIIAAEKRMISYIRLSGSRLPFVVVGFRWRSYGQRATHMGTSELCNQVSPLAAIGNGKKACVEFEWLTVSKSTRLIRPGRGVASPPATKSTTVYLHFHSVIRKLCRHSMDLAQASV